MIKIVQVEPTSLGDVFDSWASPKALPELGDCPPDPKPDQLPVVVATFAHLISTLRRHNLSVGSMFADQQIGGTPDVAVGDHCGSSHSAEFFSLDDLDSAARRVLIISRRYHNPANRGGGSASSLSVAVVLWGIAVRSLIGAAFAVTTPTLQAHAVTVDEHSFGEQ